MKREKQKQKFRSEEVKQKVNKQFLKTNNYGTIKSNRTHSRVKKSREDATLNAVSEASKTTRNIRSVYVEASGCIDFVMPSGKIADKLKKLAAALKT